MNALTTTGTAVFTPTLFNSFIAWIDRTPATARAYTKNLNAFAAWINYTDTRQPQRSDIIKYRDWLNTEHDAIAHSTTAPGWRHRTDHAGQPIRIKCKPNTIALYLRSVKAFFNWTAAAGLYPNIAENVHAPKVDHSAHRKDGLTPEQVLTVEHGIKADAAAKLEASRTAAKDAAGRVERSTEQGKRLYAMYLLAVNAGLRTIEISRANIKDLEHRGGQAYLYIWGKGHTEADTRQPIAPEVYDAIADYLKSRKDTPTGSAPLFVSTGNRSGGQRIAPTTISTMLKRAMQAAGYDSERLTAHSLRHSAAQGVMQITGRNIYEAQGYLRHADPKTTEIYLAETPEEEQAKADIARRLYDLYHGKPETLEQGLTPEMIKAIAAITAAMK